MVSGILECQGLELRGGGKVCRAHTASWESPLTPRMQTPLAAAPTQSSVKPQRDFRACLLSWKADQP